jgi:tetraacyldisaccharide 4'-kinase
MRQTLTQAWVGRGVLAWLLWPVSLFFAYLVALRRWLFCVGILKSGRISAAVVVVGNVVAGGSGKTPVVMALVRHFRERGLKLGVVSRGYGRSTRDCREVTLTSPAAEVGDEPALIKRSTGVATFVAASRIDAARALLAAYPGTQLILCDDGLQHYALKRDLEICVFDDRGVGNGFMLPAGPLREPWPRAGNLVLHTGDHPAFALGFRAIRSLAAFAVGEDRRPTPLTQLHEPNVKALVAVAAIGQPEAFFDMLRAAGLNLAHTVALPDHYDFDSWVCPFDGDFQLICTEKDAVKLWTRYPAALAVPLEVTLAPAFLEAVDDGIDAALGRAQAKLSFPHGHTTS